MKKKAIVIAAVAVVLIAAIFLIFRDQPFNQQFRETTAGLTSYLLEGDMEITKGEDIKSYALSVKYLKEQEQDYFRVSLTDKDLNQEQEIIRNQEGVYVITPSLNQIFKFEGNWPTNSLKPYLLQSMGEIMDQDGVQVEKTADGYRVSATVTYPNNHNFNVQEMLFDADAKIQYLEIFNADHVSQLKLSFTKVDYAPGLTVEDFAIPDQLEKQTAATGAMEADLPLLPMETYDATLTNSSVLENGGSLQHILEYSGDKNFTIVEHIAQSEETTQTVIMSGDLIDAVTLLGQYDGTQMTTVIDSVQYTIYSEELSEQEMAAVLSSMQVVVMK